MVNAQRKIISRIYNSKQFSFEKWIYVIGECRWIIWVDLIAKCTLNKMFYTKQFEGVSDEFNDVV